MSILRSTIVAAIVLAAPVHSSGAQIIRFPPTQERPSTWVTGSGALFDVQRFHAGSDGSEWAFGNAVQLRGSLERSLRRDIAVGIVGTYAAMPVTVLGGSCDGCRSDVDVWQALVSARLGGGGGIGFHTVLEGVAGVTRFGEVSAGPDDAFQGTVAAAQQFSPTVGVSYGAGYTITEGFEVTFGQEIGLIFSSGSAAAPDNASTRARFNATRLTIRYAIGN